jgi:hypothetical protein
LEFYSRPSYVSTEGSEKSKLKQKKDRKGKYVITILFTVNIEKYLHKVKRNTLQGIKIE